MVDVLEGDMFNVAWSVASRVNVLMVCMSNEYGVGKGTNAGHDYQEAEMFRRTDLSLHYKNHTSWPLERRDCGGVLAYNVSILRLGADFGYMFLPGNTRAQMDVLATSVPNMLHQKDQVAALQQTQDRIESLVKVGAQYEVCILSAIGCGAYGHKPQTIMEIFRKAIKEHGRGGRFLFVLRPPRKPKSRGRSNFEIFSKLRSGPGSGFAPGACLPSDEAEGDGAWPLSDLIATLPLNQGSAGILPTLHRRLATIGRLGEADLDRFEQLEGEDDYDQRDDAAEEEDPDSVEYTPGCQIRHVWLGVERYVAQERPYEGDLPRVLDKANIKIPAFLCIIKHLRKGSKNCRTTIERPKSLADMINGAKGTAPHEGDPLRAAFPGYQQIRLAPYDFEKAYGAPSDPPDGRRWLQVNESLSKPTQKALARFLLEMTCYASTITNRPNPWTGAQETEDRGSGQDTFDTFFPLFGRCIMGLYRKKHVRLLAIDSVGDVEDDSYTVPSYLFAFQQAEWPATLYFPAVHACPSMVPQKVIDTVLSFQSIAADTLARRRLALGDEEAERRGAEDLTTAERRSLAEDLGLKGRGVKKRPTGRNRPGRRRGDNAGTIPVDLEEDPMED